MNFKNVNKDHWDFLKFAIFVFLVLLSSGEDEYCNKKENVQNNVYKFERKLFF